LEGLIFGSLGSVCEYLTHLVSIGSTVINRKPKATLSRVRQWDEGEPLSFAWFGCASPEAKREYRACDIDSRRMSYRLEMQSQVLDELISGKLVAWGFREGAPPEEGPMLIPAHLFPRDREDTADIDWQALSLRSSGHSFDRIRVTKPQAGPPRNKRTSKRVKPPLGRSATPGPTAIVFESPKKKGRPRVDEPLRAVVRSLFEAGQLKDKSRKEQIEVIRTAARIAHPNLFLRETQPSKDKIYAALWAEGLISPK
jgi:hypothetical protein